MPKRGSGGKGRAGEKTARTRRASWSWRYSVQLAAAREAKTGQGDA
jgi:hypothetical protein